MLSSRLIFRAALLAATLAGSTGLAACTMTPAYDTRPAAHALALNFATPTNPLEQIVYQELSRDFATSTDPSAPSVSIVVSTASHALAQSAATNPAETMLVTATGTIRIRQNGENVLRANRQATATYVSDSQVLADNSAATAAGEQAAHALAGILSLTIMATLAPAPTASR